MRLPRRSRKAGQWEPRFPSTGLEQKPWFSGSSWVRRFWALAGNAENGKFTTELAKQLQIVIPSGKKAQPYFSFWFKTDLFNSSLPFKMRNNEAGSVTVKYNSLPFGGINILDFWVIESCHQFWYTAHRNYYLLLWKGSSNTSHRRDSGCLRGNKVCPYIKLINLICHR